MKITVAHSPGSDDAFMLYGIASGAVPTNGLPIEHPRWNCAWFRPRAALSEESTRAGEFRSLR